MGLLCCKAPGYVSHGSKESPGVPDQLEVALANSTVDQGLSRKIADGTVSLGVWEAGRPLTLPAFLAYL